MRAENGRHPLLGFTLIELMMVFVVLALAYALVVPAFAHLFPGLRLEADIRRMVGALNEARAAAIIGNRTIRFWVAVDGQSWTYEGRSGTPSQGTHLVLQAPPVGRGNDGGVISFFSDGTSTGGRLVLTAGTRARTVRVDWFTGRTAQDGG